MEASDEWSQHDGACARLIGVMLHGDVVACAGLIGVQTGMKDTLQRTLQRTLQHTYT